MLVCVFCCFQPRLLSAWFRFVPACEITTDKQFAQVTVLLIAAAHPPLPRCTCLASPPASAVRRTPVCCLAFAVLPTLFQQQTLVFPCLLVIASAGCADEPGAGARAHAADAAAGIAAGRIACVRVRVCLRRSLRAFACVCRICLLLGLVDEFAAASAFLYCWSSRLWRGPPCSAPWQFPSRAQPAPFLRFANHETMRRHPHMRSAAF
mgnify:CR=1 FL=1